MIAPGVGRSDRKSPVELVHLPELSSVAKAQILFSRRGQLPGRGSTYLRGHFRFQGEQPPNEPVGAGVRPLPALPRPAPCIPRRGPAAPLEDPADAFV